ncbi:MAG: DUF192 domain-containing protein [Sphingomonadales bacterium]
MRFFNDSSTNGDSPNTRTPFVAALFSIALIWVLMIGSIPGMSAGMSGGASGELAGNAASHAEARLEQLVIRTGNDDHVFQVEMAVTPEQRRQGLMFREYLDADRGMLFNHDRDEVATMWMKNTLIPLDMLFIRHTGEIATIAENTEPHSLKVISSRVPVRAVLEVPGGTAARLGISPGDRVDHPLFR